MVSTAGTDWFLALFVIVVFINIYIVLILGKQRRKTGNRPKNYLKSIIYDIYLGT